MLQPECVLIVGQREQSTSFSASLTTAAIKYNRRRDVVITEGPSVNTAVKDLGVRVGKRTCRAAVDAKVTLWLFIFITHFKRMNVETITRNDLKVEKTKYVTLKMSCRAERT